MRTVPLANLLDPAFDLCEWERGEVYGVLDENASCGAQVGTLVLGITGESIRVTGIWRGTLPGYAGQTVQFMYKANSACGQQCVNTVSTQDNECWVSEDIAKPIRRTIPVTPLKTVAVTDTVLSIQTRLKTNTLTLLAEASPLYINHLRNRELTNLTLITSIPPAARWVTKVDPRLSITGVSNVLAIPNALRGNISNVITSCAGVNIQVCNEAGNLQTIFVVTSCISAAVTPFSMKIFDEQVANVYTSIETVAVITEIVVDTLKNVDVEEVEIARYVDAVTTIVSIDPEAVVPTFNMLALHENGKHKFLRLTTCNAEGVCESGDVKFLSKPSIALGTATTRLDIGFCGPRYFCFRGGVEAPESANDSNEQDQHIILFSPLWTKTPMNGETCPCYATCTELPCGGPGGASNSGAGSPRATETITNAFNSGPVAPCTVSVKRLQRNWCKTCSVD